MARPIPTGVISRSKVPPRATPSTAARTDAPGSGQLDDRIPDATRTVAVTGSVVRIRSRLRRAG
jgi:hypothetical protein